LNFSDDRRNVLSKAISVGFHAGNSAIANVSELRIAEHNTASLGSLQRF
jgi:hypothetical protein